MDRKEQILWATLDLATQYGLKAITMSQIAQKVGIQKPSLYNHFKNKDEIIHAMYEFIREHAKQNSINDVDYSEFTKENSAETVLNFAVTNYLNMSRSDKLFAFYKVIYAERTLNSRIAKIMTEETNRMIQATKNLFYALQIHGKIHIEDIDNASLSFAMTIHSMMDYQFDCAEANLKFDDNMLQDYIHWFCKQIGGVK